MYWDQFGEFVCWYLYSKGWYDDSMLKHWPRLPSSALFQTKYYWWAQANGTSRSTMFDLRLYLTVFVTKTGLLFLLPIRKWWTQRPHPLSPKEKPNSNIFVHYTYLDKSFALLEMQAWVCHKLTEQSRVPCFEATLIRVVGRILRRQRRFQIPLLLVYLLVWKDCQVAFEPHPSRSQPPTTERKE